MLRLKESTKESRASFLRSILSKQEIHTVKIASSRVELGIDKCLQRRGAQARDCFWRDFEVPPRPHDQRLLRGVAELFGGSSTASVFEL